MKCILVAVDQSVESSGEYKLSLRREFICDPLITLFAVIN